jgi:hypothetical protein
MYLINYLPVSQVAIDDPWTRSHGSSAAKQSLAKSLIEFGSESSVGLETDSVDTDESIAGIRRVVVEDITSALNIHRGQIGIVEGLGGLTSMDDAVTLVKFNSNGTFNIPLAELNGVADQFHFWGKPETIVAQASKFGSQTFSDALDFTVHADSFQIHVGLSQESTSWSSVDTSRLNSDKPVLDNVDTADTVLSSNHVAVQEDFQRIGLDCSIGLVGDLSWATFHVLNSDHVGIVGGILRRSGQFEHGVISRAHGILEHTTLVGSVGKIIINGVV